MESKNNNNRRSPPHSANYTRFTEQPRRVGYGGTELGRTQPEHLRGHHPQPHSLPHPLSLTYPHPRSLPPPHSREMHEAIQRQMEKERIREEIIMSEIARRRVLEAEVRRELMMERELALRSGGNGFPFGSSSVVGFESNTKVPLLGTGHEGRSLEERIAMSLTERERLHGRGFETSPFERRSAHLRISEAGKPDENTSGSKRKAVTPPAGLDSTETPSNGILRKKVKDEWSCAICQVSTTSEQALKEHLKGKKHKSKEATLRAQKAGKNYSIGLFPKNVAKSNEVLSTGGDSHTSGSMPLLSENLNSGSSKKNQFVEVPEGQTNDNPKKKQFRFWCDLCRVGSDSLKVLNIHKRGKKHARHLEANQRYGGARPSEQKKTILLVKSEGVDEDGKKVVVPDGVDKEALEEAGSEDHEAVDAVEPEDDEPLDEKEADDHVAVDFTTKLDNNLDEPNGADVPKDEKISSTVS